MAVQTVIRGGLVVTPEGIFPGGVAIDEGKIVAVGADESLPEGRATIDARGNHITPGFIDTHTHQGLFHPFRPEIRGQSMFAARGGITTFVGTDKCTRIGQPHKEFATPEDVVPYHSVYEVAREAVNANTCVDFAFTFACMTDDHARELPSIVEDLGVTSFKFYIGSLSGDSDLWSSKLGVPGNIGYNDGTMYLGFEAIGKVGRPAIAMIHAENRPVMRIFWDRVEAEGGGDYPTFAKTCPGFVEALDIRRAALVARETGATLYVVHLTSLEGLEAIETARKEGTRIIAEVCLPWVTTSCYDDPPGIWGKVLPPLRDQETIESLWTGIRERRIQCMGTDSVSMSREIKENVVQKVAELNAAAGKTSRMASGVRKPGEPHTIWSIGVGWTVLSSYAPALVTYGVKKGRVTLERLIEVVCENNAKAMGLFPRKGSLRVGSDADVNILDLERWRKPRPLPLPEDESTTEYNLYETEELTGWPVLTMVRGKVVARDGELVGKPGDGQLVERKSPRPYQWWPV